MKVSNKTMQTILKLRQLRPELLAVAKDLQLIKILHVISKIRGEKVEAGRDIEFYTNDKGQAFAEVRFYLGDHLVSTCIIDHDGECVHEPDGALSVDQLITEFQAELEQLNNAAV